MRCVQGMGRKWRFRQASNSISHRALNHMHAADRLNYIIKAKGWREERSEYPDQLRRPNTTVTLTEWASPDWSQRPALSEGHGEHDWIGNHWVHFSRWYVQLYLTVWPKLLQNHRKPTQQKVFPGRIVCLLVIITSKGQNAIHIFRGLRIMHWSCISLEVTRISPIQWHLWSRHPWCSFA